MFCWVPLGAGIHVNATWHEPPIQTLLWAKYTPSSQQHYHPSRTVHPDTLQTLLRNSSRNTIKVLTGPPNSPEPQSDRASVGPAGAGLIHRGPTPKHTGPRGSAVKKRSEVLSLDRSELFWLHEGNLHNHRQVVIMLCLIGVYLIKEKQLIIHRSVFCLARFLYHTMCAVQDELVRLCSRLVLLFHM